jgi:hypothetical protein
MNEGQTLTFTGMRTSTRCIPHTCVEMRSRETLRFIDRSSAAIGAQTDHRWRRAICNYHQCVRADLLLCISVIHHFANRQGKEKNAVLCDWHTAYCKSRMFDPDICPMRRESGGAVGFHGCSIYALPVTYGTDHCRLQYVVQVGQST